MRLERNNKYQHILCSVIFDKVKENYQSFSRGEALTIFESCTDMWTGKAIVPITETHRKSVKDLLHQWESDDFDSIGYSYKPVTPDVEAMLNARMNAMKGETHFSKKEKDLAQSLT